MTREQLRSRIKNELTKFKPSDDFEIGNAFIDDLLDSKRALLIPQFVKENIETPPTIITTLECQTILSSTPVCITGECFAKYYVTIPQVIDMPMDKGVVSVSITGGKSLDRLDIQKIDIFKHLRWAKVSIENPAFYRIGNNVYLIGKKFGSSNKLTLNLVVYNTINYYADTVEYPMTKDGENVLVEMCLKEIIQGMSTPTDLKNDGVQ